MTGRDEQGYNNVMATATGTHEYTAPEVSRRWMRVTHCAPTFLGVRRDHVWKGCLKMAVRARVSVRALLKDMVDQVFLLDDEASDSDDDGIVTKNQIDTKYSAKVDIW